MTQQGLRQASARNLSGFATGTNYNEDFLRLFDAQGVAAGTFNERQLRWINARMGASFTNLDEAMQAYATGQGVYNWSSLGALEDTANFTRVMPYGATYTRTGAATGLTTAGLITSFAADAAQQTNRGLALEVARTNLVLQSQAFDNAAWTKNLTTVSANATTAPDGTTNADKIAESAGTAPHFVATAGTTSVVSGQAYTVTVFAKASERSFIALYEGTRGQGKYFNLATGTVLGNLVAAPDSATIDALADGWYRCRITITTAAIIAVPSVYLSPDGTTLSYAGTVGSGVFLWGAQLELGAFATSPIVTTGSALARGLPVFTEVIPAGRTKALLTYADATTTLVSSLTPGGTFDAATTVIGASKGRYASSELVSRVWQA